MGGILNRHRRGARYDRDRRLGLNAAPSYARERYSRYLAGKPVPACYHGTWVRFDMFWNSVANIKDANSGFQVNANTRVAFRNSARRFDVAHRPVVAQNFVVAPSVPWVEHYNKDIALYTPLGDHCLAPVVATCFLEQQCQVARDRSLFRWRRGQNNAIPRCRRSRKNSRAPLHTAILVP